MEYHSVVSLGYRCSSAGILKSLGLKNASYPFDWLVSRLPIIDHCTKTEFAEFLNPLNYKKKKSATHYYPNMKPNSRQWICDETILFNEFYEENQADVYIPEPLHIDNDAYAHKLMMNHHDITKVEDRSYYERCIERWNDLWRSNKRVLSLYIHPALNLDFYKSNRISVMRDIREFHKSMSAFYEREYDGIYVIPVITPYDSPTDHCSKYIFEEQEDDKSIQTCRICVLWANQRYIDAGEIFMGKCFVEEYVVKEYVQTTLKLGHLPVIS